MSKIEEIYDENSIFPYQVTVHLKRESVAISQLMTERINWCEFTFGDMWTMDDQSGIWYYAPTLGMFKNVYNPRTAVVELYDIMEFWFVNESDKTMFVLRWS